MDLALSFFTNQNLIVVLGPTGTGKSDLAIKLALAFNGEIINADSRQIYRYMDIGTAKPTLAMRDLVTHHLYDIAKPDEDLGLSQYQSLAYQAMIDIHRRQKLPIMVGGSGQYIWAVLEGWQIPHVPPESQLTSTFRRIAKEQGGEVLYRRLQELDPQSANQIDRRNIRRVIRALEVTELSDKPFSKLKKKHNPGFSSIIIGLTAERKTLYQRVDTRVDEMLKRGLASEVENLLAMGYDLGLPAMNCIGYAQIGMFLRGNISLEEATAMIKNDSHRFIRHQYSWFKLTDSRIHWLDIQNDIEAMSKALLKSNLCK